MKQFLMVLLLAVSAPAWAVPSGVPKDPPAPPTGLGRLWGQTIQPSLGDCHVTAQTATSATVGFSATYPYRARRFQRADGSWTSWTALPAGATDWLCQGTCFHETANVQVRACATSSCLPGESASCSIPIGVERNGPPDLIWAGIEDTRADVLGCAQSSHTEIVIRLRFAGAAPASGYPRIGGQAATERSAQRQDTGNVRDRVYAAPAGWTASDIAAGIWETQVSLDGTGDRDAQLSVELAEHCLSPPSAAIVAQGGNPAPVSTGQTVNAGAELEISTGNPSSVFPTITDHQLLHDGENAAFGRITPSAGSEDAIHTWSETATGRDGQAYTSSDLSLTVGAVPCEANERLADGACEPCPTYGQCVSGSLETKTWCEPGNPPAGGRTVERQACADGATVTRSVCVDASNPDPGDSPCPCPANHRKVDGNCEPCPEYIGCNPRTARAEQMFHCAAGNPPANARDFPNVRCLNPDENGWSYGGPNIGWIEFSNCGTSPPSGNDTLVERSRCINDVTVTDTVCVDNRRGIRPPQNTPCVPCPNPDVQVRVNGVCTDCPAGQRPVNGVCEGCPSGQRLVNGACEDCPEYIGCEAGFTKTFQWCEAGDPPGNARQVAYEVCVSGEDRIRYRCHAPGDAVPASRACPPEPEACPSGTKRVDGNCVRCPTYYACSSSGTARVTRSWCGAGATPADAVMDSVQRCVNGRTVSRRLCFATAAEARDEPCREDGSTPQPDPPGDSEEEDPPDDSGEETPSDDDSGSDDSEEEDPPARDNTPKPCNVPASTTDCATAGVKKTFDSTACQWTSAAVRHSCKTGETPRWSGCAWECDAPAQQGCDVPASTTDCSTAGVKRIFNTGACEWERELLHKGTPPDGTARRWNESACAWEDATVSKPCVAGYSHTWNRSSGEWRKSRSKTPKPACQQGQAEAEWNCETERWERGTVTAPACKLISETAASVPGRWLQASCSYEVKTLNAPACKSGFSTDFSRADCTWGCIAKSCTSLAKPASPSDCTAGGFAGWTILDAWIGQGGWWVRGGIARNAPPAEWVEEKLCIACEGVAQRSPKPTFTPECGTCGKTIWGGTPRVPRFCREFESCGYRYDETLGNWIEFYSGATRDEPFK